MPPNLFRCLVSSLPLPLSLFSSQEQSFTYRTFLPSFVHQGIALRQRSLSQFFLFPSPKKMKSSLVLAAAFASTAFANWGCKQGKVLNCLLGNPAQASSFCQSYISIPVVTVTVGTTTPCVYVPLSHIASLHIPDAIIAQSPSSHGEAYGPEKQNQYPRRNPLLSSPMRKLVGMRRP
jgi:hypothetical protein